jgi:hypothetical protein
MPKQIKRIKKRKLKSGDLYQCKKTGKLYVVTVPGKRPEWGVRCVTGSHPDGFPRTASIKLLSSNYKYRGNAFKALSYVGQAIDDSKHK